jgi:antitoxin ParD1/3/4
MRENSMPLTITLELSPSLEAEIRQSLKERNAEHARYLLADALLPTVEDLLEQVSEPMIASDEWEALADQLGEELATSLPADAPPLSDYAVSRAGIYEDHP